MKKISEIEALTPEQLELVAADASVPVPEDLKASLEALAGAAELAGILKEGAPEQVRGEEETPEQVRGEEETPEQVRGEGRPRKSTVWRWAIAAAAAAVVALAVTLSVPSRPKDTFSDPLLAYAEVQRAFDLISARGEQAMDIAGKAVPVMEKTDEIIRKITK